MDKITLSATKRDLLGKKVRFLRRQGLTPANIYGRDVKSIPVQIDTTSLKQIIAKAGTSSLVTLSISGEKKPVSIIMRGIQRDPLTHELLHVDLYQVQMESKIKLEIPIELVGESPAVKDLDGILIQNLSSVDIECLPAHIPYSFEVNIGQLTEIDQALYVRDLARSEAVDVLTDPDKVIALVTGRRAMEIEEGVPEAEVEVEIAGEAKEQEAEAETAED